MYECMVSDINDSLNSLTIAIFAMAFSTLTLAVTTFVITFTKDVYEAAVQEEAKPEAEEAEAQEAEAEVEEEDEEAQEAQEAPVAAPITMYTAAADADQIIIREHRKKPKGHRQITAIVRFLQENGSSTKDQICDAMTNLGENYTGGSSQRVRFTVSCWLNQPELNKGCISTN